MELSKKQSDMDVIGQQSAKMIPWIDSLLEKWARWKTASGWHGGGCGVSSLLLTEHRELDRIAGQRDSPDDLMLDVDTAVGCLPPELKAVVQERYERGGFMEQKARALGISKRTLEYRLGKVHQAIKAALDHGPDKVPVLQVGYWATRSGVAKEKRLAA